MGDEKKSGSSKQDTNNQKEVIAFIYNLFLLRQRFKVGKDIDEWFESLGVHYSSGSAASNDNVVDVLKKLDNSMHDLKSAKINLKPEITNIALTILDKFLHNMDPMAIRQDEIEYIKKILSKIPYVISRISSTGSLGSDRYELMIKNYGDLVQTVHEVVITAMSKSFISFEQTIEKQAADLKEMKGDIKSIKASH